MPTPDTPTKIKALRGNPGKRAMNKNEPQAPKGKPSPPAHLDIDALREWKRIIPILSIMKLLSSADQTLIAMYCTAQGRWANAERQIIQYGPVQAIETKTGKKILIQNPYLAIANKAMEQAHKFGNELGLSPAVRSKLHVEMGKENDPAKEFLFGG